MQPMVGGHWDTAYERPAAWERAGKYDENAPLCRQCGVNETIYDSEPGSLPEGHRNRYSSFCYTCFNINHCAPRHVHEERYTEAQLRGGSDRDADHTWTTAYQARAIIQGGRIAGWRCTRCPAETAR